MPPTKVKSAIIDHAIYNLNKSFECLLFFIRKRRFRIFFPLYKMFVCPFHKRIYKEKKSRDPKESLLILMFSAYPQNLESFFRIA